VKTKGEIANRSTEHLMANNQRILVVEDHFEIRTCMERLLRLWGFEVATATTGVEALQRADEFRPDVILLDIGLPELDGFGVARRLRDDASKKDTLIIAVTAYAGDEWVRRCQETGFDYHMSKPIDFDRLRSLIGAP
jgi:CheY-like chemotaxis protein